MVDPRRNPQKKRNGTSARRVIPVTKPEEQKKEIVELEEPGNISEEKKDENKIASDQIKPDPIVLQLQEKLLRLQAEFDNYRKRQARDFRKRCDQG